MPFDKVHVIQKMLELGLIDRDTLARILTTCKGREIDILKILANYAGMTQSDIRKFAADHFEMPEVDLNDIALNPEVVKLVPYQVAIEHRLIPAFKISKLMHIAVSDPFDFTGIDRATKYLGYQSSIFLATEDQVIRALESFQNN
jgi:type IV pilus assembly protein PilB